MVAAFGVSASMVVQAADLKEFTGTWVMRCGARNLLVLSLTAESSDVRGTFERPAALSRFNGIFFGMRGVRDDRVVRSRFADGVLHLTTQNANDAHDEDSYVMIVSGSRAELIADDLPPGMVMQPDVFDRAAAGATVAKDWEPNRAYVPGDSDVPSAEMKVIYDEDQSVRAGGHIDWQVVGRSDAGRRDQTRKLLSAGALHTGKDFEEAAFVFQHGDSAPDFLLAHTLAMVAVTKGDPPAIWIAAATLDRYLEHVAQKQIFGTQFNIDPSKKWTQEPYDREMVSDALRLQLGVPSLAVQAEQLKAYAAQK
jgi:hypothetical protein